MAKHGRRAKRGLHGLRTALPLHGKLFGLGSGLAILIDDIAVRGVLVPAAMRLLGRSAWCAPRPLRRFHDRFGLSEGTPGAVPAPAAHAPLVKDSTGV